MQAFFRNVLSPVGIIVSLILIGLALCVVISMAIDVWNIRKTSVQETYETERRSKKWVFNLIIAVPLANILFGIFQEGAFSPEGGLYPTIVLNIFFLVLILMGLLSVVMARRRIRQLQRQASDELL
jgi:cytochrome bd-type quinol oxidase subunit 2